MTYNLLPSFKKKFVFLHEQTCVAAWYCDKNGSMTPAEKLHRVYRSGSCLVKFVRGTPGALPWMSSSSVHIITWHFKTIWRSTVIDKYFSDKFTTTATRRNEGQVINGNYKWTTLSSRNDQRASGRLKSWCTMLTNQRVFRTLSSTALWEDPGA